MIEDSPVLQRLIAVALRDTGIEVDAHLDGTGGLDAAIANPPDLIILDLGLPDISGWEVLERLRSHPSTTEIPVLVATGQTRHRVADRAAAFGAVTLEKPYTGAVLRATALVLIDIRSTVVASP